VKEIGALPKGDLQHNSERNKDPHMAETDSQHQVHELEVHLTELEKQNEVLKKAQAETEHAYLLYTDLYDFAPVGYFRLAHDGTIRQVNLAGANLLGVVTRANLIKQRLGSFVDSEYRTTFGTFLENLWVGKGMETCELRLAKEGNRPLWVRLEATCFEGGQESRVMLTDITDRKQAEQALSKSEERFHKAFQSGPVGLAITRASDGVYIDANAAFSELIGFSREELIGSTSLNLKITSPEQRNEYAHQMSEEGFIHNQEMVLRHRSGESRVVLGSMEIIELNNETCVLSTAIDITERKQAEAKIHRINRLYATISQINQTIVRAQDRSTLFSDICRVAIVYGKFRMAWIGMIDESNGNVKPIAFAGEEHGYLNDVKININDEKMHGGPFIMAIHAGHSIICQDIANASHLSAWRDQALQRGYRSSASVPIRQKDISVGAFSVYTSETHGFDDDDQQLLDGIGMDISYALDALDVEIERKQAEEALRTSKLIIEGIINTIPTRVFWKDRNLKYLGCNAIFAHDAGFTDPKDIIGKDDYAMGWKAQAELYRSDDRQVIENGSPKLLIEEIQTTPEGKAITLLTSKIPLRNSRGEITGVLGTYMDITERKRTEELLQHHANELETRVKERTAELLRANRTKDEFLANMSHELRTPLNGILGYSEILLEGVHGSINEKQSQSIEIIHSSGQHLLGLISDILDVSKIESGKFELKLEKFQLNEVCQSSLIFIKQLALKKSIVVEYSSSPSEITLLADPRRLKQILVNLLNNAVKFTPDHGKVRFEVQADAQAGQIQFSINDTGIGIASADLEKLFEPFVQLESSLSRQYEGTGLGLSLAKRLIEMHGGSIGVESVPDRGSCFHFNIPIIPLNMINPETVIPQVHITPDAGTGPNGKKKVILLVEDNAINMMVTSEYLSVKGYQVINVVDGLKAIQQARTRKPDLILMDIQLPGISGIDAIRTLRTEPEFALLPIIALTALAMPGDRELCFEAGVTEYLSKPFSLKKLVEMMENLLQ